MRLWLAVTLARGILFPGLNRWPGICKLETVETSQADFGLGAFAPLHPRREFRHRSQYLHPVKWRNGGGVVVGFHLHQNVDVFFVAEAVLPGCCRVLGKKRPALLPLITEALSA